MEKMINYWKNDTDSEKSDNDIWKYLNGSSRWFVPSEVKSVLRRRSKRLLVTKS